MSDHKLCLTLVTGKKARILATLVTGDETECRVEAENLIQQLKIEKENARVHPVFASALKSFVPPVYPGGKR
jgi:hypothetical protein